MASARLSNTIVIDRNRLWSVSRPASNNHRWMIEFSMWSMTRANRIRHWVAVDALSQSSRCWVCNVREWILIKSQNIIMNVTLHQSPKLTFHSNQEFCRIVALQVSMRLASLGNKSGSAVLGMSRCLGHSSRVGTGGIDRSCRSRRGCRLGRQIGISSMNRTLEKSRVWGEVRIKFHEVFFTVYRPWFVPR